MTSSPSNQSPPLYDGPIVDAHVHYWNPRNTPREVSPLVKLLGWNLGLTNWMAKRIFPEAAILFFATPKYLTNNYLPDDYNAEFETTNQVKGIVHVEANWTGKDPVDETRWLESLQTNNASTILGIVSHVDLTLDLNSVEKILQSHKEASSKVCGIRDAIMWHSNHQVLSFAPQEHRSRLDSFRASFPLLEKYKLTFETFCYSDQLKEVTELAQAFPNQRILLDHVGTPIAIGGQFAGHAGVGENDTERLQITEQWKADIRQLALCRNVYCKVSGLGMPVCGFAFAEPKKEPSVDTLVDKLSPLILFCIQVFGARRCMFGSNFPVDKVSVPSLDTYLVVYKRILQQLPRSDQEWIFERTATEFYSLNKE